jgi:hypothetical protein
MCDRFRDVDLVGPSPDLNDLKRLELGFYFNLCLKKCFYCKLIMKISHVKNTTFSEKQSIATICQRLNTHMLEYNASSVEQKPCVCNRRKYWCWKIDTNQIL